MSEEANEEVAEMLDEYDFAQGEIGKYSTRYADGTNVVLLDTCAAKMSPDSHDENLS